MSTENQEMYSRGTTCLLRIKKCKRNDMSTENQEMYSRGTTCLLRIKKCIQEERHVY